ncbi:MAG: hypothetical protein ABIL16_06475 [candidate division WOR-3 bacterium]
MPWIITFIGDIRGFYPSGNPEYVFPSKFSDVLTFKGGGSRVFGELYEGFLGWGYMGVGGGFRFFGTLDGVFRDNSIYVGGKYKGFGISAIYGWVSIGDYYENALGAMLSAGNRGEVLDVWISAGYLYTPIIAFEGYFKGNFATLFINSFARPGIYEVFTVGVILDFGDIDVGGVYRNLGNTFGITVSHNIPLGFMNISVLNHEDLGEVISFQNAFVFPR